MDDGFRKALDEVIKEIKEMSDEEFLKRFTESEKNPILQARDFECCCPCHIKYKSER